ncbi:hypothetical protein BO78DRAFT_429300 [Aspergillus sclerotiicarbonarius CBS 121057]|uniref:Zn(2)-C6 fungal-type domain-containing protein n=1 Tax=Aspergillus sclerotiicarbonarius (strain CBS 121057 / IBT 28362) TaxID=1448318 RepID=A0A319EAA2_ASPSB|nr:hypothetical protein BO78DRAFT_429300 [Aspergillus sclerotiicarbonarius CBS 121057]
MSSRKRKNIALACDLCRARKIRCDGIEPICSSRDRRNASCSYPSNDPRKRFDNRYIRQVRDGLYRPETSGADSLESLDPTLNGSNVSDGRVFNGIGSKAQNRSDQEITPVAPSIESIPSSADIQADDNAYTFLSVPNAHPTSHGDPQSNSRESKKRLTAMGITPDRPLSPSESQDEFFGDSSVASLLRQINVSGTNPANINTSPKTWPRMAEASESAVTPYDLPSRQLADYLLECYFDKFHCLYPFIHRPCFLRAYNNLWKPKAMVEVDKTPARIGFGLGDAGVQSSTFLCALNIILALGCQFSQLDHAAREAVSEDFFQRSQKYLNIVTMDKGDLALVQTLLLTATYLQGDESPSKCWNIIGLACRVAQGVGMHSLKADRNRSPAEIQMRRRVWHGCVMLDLASSMMLGRPPMTHTSPVPLPEALDDESLDPPVPLSPNQGISRTEFYIQTLQLHTILRKILLAVYEPLENPSVPNQLEHLKTDNNHAPTLMKLGAELLAFQSQLPAPLQWNMPRQPASPSDQFRRESSLLRARFLHLRTLLLRPTLVNFCREGRIPNHIDKSHPPGHLEEQHTGLESKISLDFSLSCATYCVETAIELSHLMNEISRTELASVWWYSIFYTFTAGVVLILAQTSTALETNFSKQRLRDAWQSCTDCLETMGSYSSTAHVYADCLRKTLSQSLHDGSGNTSAPVTSTQDAASRPVGAGLSPAHAPVVTFDTIPADQLSFGLPDPEAMHSPWGGRDPAGSLLEMMWDDSWLTAPTLF